MKLTANVVVAWTCILGLPPASAGCTTRETRAPGAEESVTSAAAPPPALTADAAATGAATASSRSLVKRVRIALIAKSATNPAFLGARVGAEDRARELSARLGVGIDVEWMTPAQESPRLQVQRIEQAVNERFDAILISCSDDTTVAAAIDGATARGVPVMTFDSDAPRSRRFSFCGVDDEQLGRAVMKELVGVLPRKARIAVLAGSEGAPNLRRRLDGLLEEAAHHRRLKIVGTFFHPETPAAAAAALLRVVEAYPKVTGLAILGGWPLYTRTLLGELQPGTGKGRYRIVAVDALPPQLVYVEKGLAPVLLAQPTYLWGAVGVETIVDKVVLGKAVPENIRLEMVRVTAKNLGTWARQLQIWGFVDVPDEYLNLP